MAATPRRSRRRAIAEQAATLAALEARIAVSSARIVALEGELARERFEHAATHNLYVRLLDTCDGIFTRAEFRSLLACLHPDWVTDPVQKTSYQEVFALLTALEVQLLKCDERPVTKPRKVTAVDFQRMRQAKRAADAAKRAAARARRQVAKFDKAVT